MPTSVEDIASWLESKSLKWELDKAVPLTKINRQASMKNQARLAPLDPDTLEQYTLDMKNKAKFPPVLSYEKNQRYVIIDGNHRYQAALDAGVKSLDHIVVLKPSEQIIRTLTFEANLAMKHGLPPSREDRIQLATNMVAMGISVNQAARIYKLNREMLYKHRNAQSADERAAQLLKGEVAENFFRLALLTKHHLSQLDLDSVFKDAATITAGGNLSSAEVIPLITSVRAKPSEAAQLQVLQNYRNTHKTRLAVGNRRIPRDMHTLSWAIGTVLGLDISKTSINKVTEEYAREVKDKCVKAIKKLTEIRGML